MKSAQTKRTSSKKTASGGRTVTAASGSKKATQKQPHVVIGQGGYKNNPQQWPTGRNGSPIGSKRQAHGTKGGPTVTERTTTTRSGDKTPRSRVINPSSSTRLAASHTRRSGAGTTGKGTVKIAGSGTKPVRTAKSSAGGVNRVSASGRVGGTSKNASAAVKKSGVSKVSPGKAGTSARTSAGKSSISAKASGGKSVVSAKTSGGKSGVVSKTSTGKSGKSVKMTAASKKPGNATTPMSAASRATGANSRTNGRSVSVKSQQAKSNMRDIGVSPTMPVKLVAPGTTKSIKTTAIPSTDRKLMTAMKSEFATELDTVLQQGYHGQLSASQAGKIAARMVTDMVNQLQRNL